MLDTLFLVKVEIDISLRPALFPPILQAVLVDNQVFIGMVIAEANIGLRPAIFLHITKVN